MNTQAYQLTRDQKNLWKNELIPQRNKFLADECKLAIKRMGQRSADAEIVRIAILDTQKLIENKFEWYSLDEIKEVLRLGSIGELGENNFFSSKTVAQWFRFYSKDYRQNVARLAKPDTKFLPKASKPQRLTSEQVDEYEKEMYKLYHEDGTLFSATYDILSRYGRIKNTQAEIKRFLENAEIRVKKEQNESVQKGKTTFIDYINARENGDTMEHKIDACAKRLAVANKFDLMKLKEKVK